MNGWFGLGLGGGALVGLGIAASLGVMEVSSSSAFCGSCHVMKKYHASWSDSTHRDVACVECHMPTELDARFKKKLEGVSMMAGTMIGSVSAHMSPEVDDRVCLKCHERRLLIGQEWFNTVLFDHRPHLAELRRGVRLTCSSCHSQIVQGSHITVTEDSCLVCHFMKREVNAKESACALCHQVDGLIAERNGRRFDHSRAVELAIDCEACHAPGPTEVGAVPRERCLTCHSLPERLAKFGDIHFLVETHVNNSRALCSDCHRDLRHIGERHEGPDPVRCSACHELRRTPQLNLFTGLGLDPEGVGPSPMHRAGVRCEACHVEPPGMTTKPADERACLRCHPLGVERLFGWWMETVEERQTIARRMFDETATRLGPRSSPSLSQAGREIGYVERGHGVHNLPLAMSILDSAVAKIAVARLDAGLPPQPPPWPQSMPASECLRCHRGFESRSVLSFGRDFGHASHVSEGSLECERCHSRHEQRRDEGAASLLFDQPGCQGCHHEQIDVETCASCHQDLHRAQFAEASCDACHAADYWTPAPGFDHQASAYPLTGAHGRVACAECHLAESTTGGVVVRYAGIRHDRCEDCHENIHAARFDGACEDCHVTDDWRQVDREAFDHETTRYPLRGRHIETECAECHPPETPTRLETFEACADCHDDEHHSQFAARTETRSCEPCHTVQGFMPTSFSPDDHQQTDFPLRGAHLAVPCNECHVQISLELLSTLLSTSTPSYHPATAEAAVQFRFTSTACDACHQDPHAGGTDEFMRDRGCEACHREGSWDEVAFDHELEAFALEGKHRDVACAECHPRLPEEATDCVQLRGVPLTCVGCHENPHVAAAALGSRTADCESCHTADGWKTTRFDHRRDARFPLVAAHSEAACGSCHPDSRYEQTPAACSDCHVDPHRGELGLACERCHTPHGWNHNVEALTSHSESLFPLDGAHATLDCAGCHDQSAPFEFSTTPTDCFACHAEAYDSTSRPDHALLGLSIDCVACHDSRSWLGAEIDPMADIDHDAVYELAGGHRLADCAGCHAAGYSGTPRDCQVCHLDDYENSTDPDHRLTGLPADCVLCHTVDDWRQVTWDHSQLYPLEGAHRGLDCAACHTPGYTGASSDCYSCHEADYASAEPDHRAAGFDLDCTTCHDQRGWDRTGFDHAAIWPLTGGHRGLECASCHADGFAGTATDCFGCHLRDYRRVTDPDHRAAGFARTCEDCHDTRSWSQARLDHDLVFVLGGAHRRVDCVACHADGYSGTPRDCAGCHLDDYNSVRDPNHRAAGFSTDCTDCHTDDGWLGAGIDHEGAFPLTAGHGNLECEDCHAGGYAGTSSDCYDCHRGDYVGAQDPDHQAAGLDHDCLLCHTTGSWSEATIDHAPYYELTGAHAGLECAACHADGYAGTPTDCIDCHQADFDSTLDPDHRAAGFPSDCTYCHTTAGWQGTTFDHDLFYLLDGAHVALDCVSCHLEIFAGTPRECSGCHLDSYEATTNPDHQAADFSLDCELCHSTVTWSVAVFSEHDNLFFPIYTGTHRDLWGSCYTCHRVVGDYSFFTCTVCHNHRRDRMDRLHLGVAGYEYDSLACYACHPNGRVP